MVRRMAGWAGRCAGVAGGVLLLTACGGGGGGSDRPPDGYLTPVSVSSALSFATIETSEQHGCGVTDDDRLYCWGTNEYGELGSSGPMATCYDSLRGPFPCTGTPTEVADAPAFVSLAAALGADCSCGLTADRQAWCWGFGLGGQLGDGLRRNSSRPVAVAGGLRFTRLLLAPSGLGACGLTAVGEAWCWGPLYEKAGEGGKDAVFAVPTRMDWGQTFVDLDLGENHACGLTADGQAWCWGNNWYGQLGLGSAGGSGGLTEALVPTPVASGLTFRAIATGSNQTCALTPAGAAYCWGSGQNVGSAGHGGYVATPQPVAGNLNFVGIYAGFLHSCGLTAAGEAWCWGENYSGELGDGTRTPSDVPVRVATDRPFVALSHRPTCGLAVGGEALCWGDNSYGQVGRPPALAE